MAETLKVLGQTFPAAATLTNHYSVPNSTTVTVSVLRASNKSATPTSIRVSIRVQGTADTDKQYVCYDKAIAANESYDVIRGMTLGANDEIWVYATLATVAFNSFGVQVT